MSVHLVVHESCSWGHRDNKNSKTAVTCFRHRVLDQWMALFRAEASSDPDTLKNTGRVAVCPDGDSDAFEVPVTVVNISSPAGRLQMWWFCRERKV